MCIYNKKYMSYNKNFLWYFDLLYYRLSCEIEDITDTGQKVYFKIRTS